MNTPFKKIFEDKIIYISFWVSVAFFVLSFIIVGLAYTHFPPFLPIYNKLAWGYARLGHTYEIFIPIGLPILLSVINLFLAKYTYEKLPLLSRFLLLVTLLIALFTLIFIIKLTLIIL